MNWRYSNQAWNNEQSNLPLQEDLTSWQAHLEVLWRQAKSHWGYGPSLQKVIYPERLSLEEIDLKDSWLFGVAVDTHFDISENWRYQLQMSLHTNGSLFAPYVMNSFTRKIKSHWGSSQPFFGFHLDIEGIFGENSLSGLYNKSGLMLGVDW